MHNNHNLPIPDPNQTTITLLAHLFLSHLLAAGVALGVWQWLTGDVRGKTAVALAVAGLCGLLFTLHLLWILRQMDWSLVYLLNESPAPPLAPRRYSALAGMAQKIALLTERERPFAQQRQQQLQQARATAAQEERHRLARDLHDSIKQQLFSIQISAAAAQARWGADDAGAQAALADVGQSAHAALVEMNALLQQLAPALLENVGLVQALQEQAEALGYRTGAEVSVALGNLPAVEHLSPGAQEAIFRTVQEAFSNVARHARASRVTLSSAITENAVTGQTLFVVQVADDGVGFDSAKVTGGMGLANISQRMAQVGGSYTLETAPGQGTTIRLLIPVAQYQLVEEQMKVQPDHALNRLCGTGLLGGLLITVLMAYPLRYLEPGLWQGVNGIVGLLFVLAALATAVATGYWGARQVRQTTRQGNLIGGGLAGLLATTLFFAVEGGAAASVAGAQTLLKHGYVTAVSEYQFIYLLVDSLNGIIWWLFGGVWLLAAVGVVAGVMGGALAPLNKSNPADNDHLRSLGHVVMVAFVLSSMLYLVITAVVFALLGEQMTLESAAGFPLTLPIWGATFWPIWTPMLIYFCALIGAWLLLAKSSLTDTAVARWERLVSSLVEAFAAAFLPIVFFSAGAQFRTGWILGGMLLNLLLALLIYQQSERLRNTFALRPDWQANSELIRRLAFPVGAVLTFVFAWSERYVPALILLFLTLIVLLLTDQRMWAGVKRPYPLALKRALESFLPSLLAVTLPGVITISAVIGVVFLVVVSTSTINPAGDNSGIRYTVPGQINHLYQVQGGGFALYLALSFMLVSFVLLLFKIGSELAERRQERSQ